MARLARSSSPVRYKGSSGVEARKRSKSRAAAARSCASCVCHVMSPAMAWNGGHSLLCVGAKTTTNSVSVSEVRRWGSSTKLPMARRLESLWVMPSAPWTG